MSTHDYRTRHEILIAIAADARAAVEKKKKQKAPLPPSKPRPRFLPRRKRGELIRFFDLGQYRTGPDVYTSWDWSVSPDAAGVPGIFDGLDVDPIDETDCLPLVDDILAIPDGDRANDFYRLRFRPGNFYDDFLVGHILVRIDPLTGGDFIALDELAGMTDEGLTLNPGETFRAIYADNALFNCDFYLADDADVFVTTEPDHTADHVTFTPSAQFDFYLMPQIINHSSQTIYRDGSSLYYESLNYQWGILLRTLIDEYTDWLSYFLPSNPYGVFYQGQILMKGMAGIRRAWRGQETPLLIPFPYDPDAYPNASLYRDDGLHETGSLYNQFYFTNFSDESIHYVRLKAMIFQAGTWFYFWDTLH